MTLEQLVKEFNIAANTAFNKGYMELDPRLKTLVYEFMSGPRESTKFPITKIMSKISKFTGNRKHNSPSDAFYVQIFNEEYDGSIDVPRRELMRAQAANSLTGLDMYVKEINSLGAEAKDTPLEDILDMIEEGHTSTYGVTFDGQNMFDTTHAFDNQAGTQSNLLTGTGITAVQVANDLDKAIAALRSFHYTMDDGSTKNKKKRKLNKTLSITVVCPDEMVSTFEKINKSEYLADGVTNIYKGMIGNIITRPLSDTNDWYIMDTSEASVKPFIISTEEVPVLEMPESNDFQKKEHKVLTWGLEGFSYGKAYGAWWKAVKTTNA